MTQRGHKSTGYCDRPTSQKVDKRHRIAKLKSGHQSWKRPQNKTMGYCPHKTELKYKVPRDTQEQLKSTVLQFSSQYCTRLKSRNIAAIITIKNLITPSYLLIISHIRDKPANVNIHRSLLHERPALQYTRSMRFANLHRRHYDTITYSKTIMLRCYWTYCGTL